MSLDENGEGKVAALVKRPKTLTEVDHTSRHDFQSAKVSTLSPRGPFIKCERNDKENSCVWYRANERKNAKSVTSVDMHDGVGSK